MCPGPPPQVARLHIRRSADESTGIGADITRIAVGLVTTTRGGRWGCRVTARQWNGLPSDEVVAKCLERDGLQSAFQHPFDLPYQLAASSWSSS